MPKSTYIQGEILPPLSQADQVRRQVSDEHLNLIATWLDDRFQIPGTTIRFGLDALIGWIPGIGDALAALASLIIIFAAWKRGAARITLIRMLLNLSIEDALGAVPILGDMAHIAWKANRRNYNLLMRDHHVRERNTWRDWLFVVGACLLLCVIFITPFLLLVYLIKSPAWR
jgi:hypothetical protein